MPENLITNQTELSGNIVRFCRYLRHKGFRLTISEEADALRAISDIPKSSEAFFRRALKSVLAKNRYQFEVFDEYYQEFWDQLDKAVDSKVREEARPTGNPNRPKHRQARFESLKDWLNLSPSEDTMELAAHSDLETWSKKDFADLSEQEMRSMLRTLERLARRVSHRKSRLRKVSAKRHQVDLKRTVRQNMRRGGDINRFVFSEKKKKKMHLVLLCDVSRSMDLYSRFFIHMIYAFQQVHDKIDTFVFSTALHDVGGILQNHDLGKAFEIIADRVPQWSGGTTIGQCLQEFVDRYGHGLLHRKTIVFIVSDGWDTSNPETMDRAMRTIKKKARKVIWLNPLAGNPNFSPVVMGMKAALPHIDILAPAHNLESLEAIMKRLG